LYGKVGQKLKMSFTFEGLVGLAETIRITTRNYNPGAKFTCRDGRLATQSRRGAGDEYGFSR
jgi:hypothetical protein